MKLSGEEDWGRDDKRQTKGMRGIREGRGLMAGLL